MGHSVGVTLGYTYGDFLSKDPQIKREQARSDLANLMMLVAGRQEYSLIGTMNAGYIFKAHRDKFPVLPRLVGTGERQGLYVSFSRKRPESQQAADLLDAGLAKIQQNGAYKKIETEWLTRYPIDLAPVKAQLKK